jgi:hypothetical protein
MNFTTIEHIREIINDGAIYWTLRDRNNSAILAEQTAAISAGDSYDKLTRNIKEMRGDFVKLSLSQRAPAEKGSGGNTKSFGPFNIEIQGAGSVQATIGAAPMQQTNYFEQFLSERDARQRAEFKLELKEIEDRHAQNFNQYVPQILGFLQQQFNPVQNTQPQINEPATDQDTPQINAPVFTFKVGDELTARNLATLAKKPKFAEALNNLVLGGDMAWNQVLEKLMIK